MNQNMEGEVEEEISNMSSVLHKVADLYASHLMSDITLVVGETSFPAHRVILSASSDVFQCMLMNPQWKETNERIIHLHEDKKAADYFHLFLKYLYTGQVRVSVESAMPLLSLADKYNIKDLVVLSRDYMMKNIAVAGKRGFLISWLQYTLTSKTHLTLTNEMKNFLCLNLEIVGASKDFVDFDPNNLISLLQQNDLVIESESKLLDIVEGWLMQKKEQIEQEESLSDEEKHSHMQSLVIEVCSYVRFPMLGFQDLANIPLKPMVQLAKEFFMDRVALGFSFHANHPLPVDPEYMQFTPRLYTSDIFAIDMVVPQIHAIDDYKHFAAGFFSLQEFPHSNRESSEVQWEIDFFPRGIQFQRAQLINVFYTSFHPSNALEIPEVTHRSVRVRCTCRANMSYGDYMRYKVAVVVCGVQSNVIYSKSLFTRIHYFSREHRSIIFDHLMPFEELDIDNSSYLLGKKHDTIKVIVIIIPFHQSNTQDSPPLDFK